MVIITLVLGLICIFVGAFVSQDASNGLAVLWSRLACGIAPVKVTLTGRKNYTPGRPYVVVANHQSMVDIPAIHGFIRLHIKWVMKQELRKIPVFGIACHYLGCIFVDRSHHQSAIESIRQARKRMSPKASVLFLPKAPGAGTDKYSPLKKGPSCLPGKPGCRCCQSPSGTRVKSCPRIPWICGPARWKLSYTGRCVSCPILRIRWNEPSNPSGPPLPPPFPADSWIFHPLHPAPPFIPLYSPFV